MSGSALILRADALRLPLPDESVDLIVSSPPYFALRSYRDGDEHYAGQIGSEPTPQAFLEALWAVMAECWRVLKPTGSCFINLGDKRDTSGRHRNGLGAKAAVSARVALAGTGSRPSAAFGRAKSKMLLPHRFAIGCEDGMADPEGKGWIMRSDIVWQKLNGLPESVTDRCRDSHEYLFHFTKEGRYFAAVDEVREGYAPGTAARYAAGFNVIEGEAETAKGYSNGDGGPSSTNPLGKLPGSVWALPSEPLIISPEVKAHYDLPDHFAAFPTELVRRVILGWSPSGVCVECGEGRRPVVAKEGESSTEKRKRAGHSNYGKHIGHDLNFAGGHAQGPREATITGYSCRCPSSCGCCDAASCAGDKPGVCFNRPPTRPAVVLDVFGGTGTTAGVARALGRIGVSVDLSHDYSRLADWRVHRSGHFAKVVNRTNRENQQDLFGVPA